jgi:hypothetical protein
VTPRTRPARTCEICRFDGGFHYDDPDNPTRCPNYLAADLMIQALAMTEAANHAATEAARLIVEDAARTHYEFSANTIRAEVEAADIPGPVMGAAFVWAAGKAGLIEGTGRRVMSTDPATRHKIEIWRSKVWRGADAARGWTA